MIYINDRLFDLDTSLLQRSIDALPQWRREVVLRFTQELGRRQSLLAYQLLCDGLRQDFGIDTPPRFRMGAHGKPFLPDYPQIHFNLSHCREAVACAVDTEPVGIDIETYRLPSDRVLRYAMNEDEQRRIRESVNPRRTFTILWTQKEALVKLSGEGITHALPGLLLNTPHRLQTLVTERYVCTLARE